MGTNYLERYLAGEYEQVWSELQALGPAVRQKPYLAEARKVATETMRRVRRNCERHGIRYATQPTLRRALRSHSRHLRSMGALGIPAEIEMG